MFALDGRRHIWRLRQHGDFLADGFRVGGLDGFARGVGGQRDAAEEGRAESGGAQVGNDFNFMAW
jgi:hypothetical protein